MVHFTGFINTHIRFGQAIFALSHGRTKIGNLKEWESTLPFRFLLCVCSLFFWQDLHTSALCDIRDLSEMIWSDFGSLHMCTTPKTRNRE